MAQNVYNLSLNFDYAIVSYPRSDSMSFSMDFVVLAASAFLPMVCWVMSSGLLVANSVAKFDHNSDGSMRNFHLYRGKRIFVFLREYFHWRRMVLNGSDPKDPKTHSKIHHLLDYFVVTRRPFQKSSNLAHALRLSQFNNWTFSDYHGRACVCVCVSRLGHPYHFSIYAANARSGHCLRQNGILQSSTGTTWFRLGPAGGWTRSPSHSWW